VVFASATYSSLRLKAYLDQLETIAALPQVTFVQSKVEALTSRAAGTIANPSAGPMGVDGPAGTRPLRRTFDRSKFAAAVQSAMPHGQGQGPGAQVAVGTGQGSRETEGDTTHRA